MLESSYGTSSTYACEDKKRQDSAHNHTAPTRHAQRGKDKKTSKEKTPSSYRGRSRELPFCLSLTTREKRGIPESERYTLLWCQGEVTEVELPSSECATTCPELEPVKKNFAGKLGTRQIQHPQRFRFNRYAVLVIVLLVCISQLRYCIPLYINRT